MAFAFKIIFVSKLSSLSVEQECPPVCVLIFQFISGFIFFGIMEIGFQ